MAYRVNDFFCGAGGVGIGFQEAGFDVIWACDFDKYAVETYRKNVGSHVIQADVKELTHADIPGADVWAFGFPCQDLSVAGVRKGFCFKCSDCGEEFTLNDAEYSNGVKCPKCRGMRHTAASRSGMFFEVMRLLDETEENNPEKMPKVLMAENVKGLKQYIPVLEQEFQKRGYIQHTCGCSTASIGMFRRVGKGTTLLALDRRRKHLCSRRNSMRVCQNFQLCLTRLLMKNTTFPTRKHEQSLRRLLKSWTSSEKYTQHSHPAEKIKGRTAREASRRKQKCLLLQRRTFTV